MNYSNKSADNAFYFKGGAKYRIKRNFWSCSASRHRRRSLLNYYTTRPKRGRIASTVRWPQCCSYQQQKFPKIPRERATRPGGVPYIPEALLYFRTQKPRDKGNHHHHDQEDSLYFIRGHTKAIPTIILTDALLEANITHIHLLHFGSKYPFTQLPLDTHSHQTGSTFPFPDHFLTSLPWKSEATITSVKSQSTEP